MEENGSDRKYKDASINFQNKSDSSKADPNDKVQSVNAGFDSEEDEKDLQNSKRKKLESSNDNIVVQDEVIETEKPDLAIE